MSDQNPLAENYFELTIPGYTDYLDVVINCIREVAKRSCLDLPDLDMLLLGAEEAFTNMTKHACIDEESQAVKVSCRIIPGKFFLSFHDRGIPFDSTIVKVFTPPSDIDFSRIEPGGIGLYLINKIFDEVFWVNHGRNGKELRLIKNWIIHEDEQPESRPSDDSLLYDYVSSDEKHSFSVRLFTPDDAIKLSRLFYKTYGYSLEYEVMYYPDRLTELVIKGNYISVVCIDDNTSEIVGHLGVSRNPESMVAEASYSAISPEYRREHDILFKMVDLLTRTAGEKGAAALSANVALYHTFSQKIALKDNYIPCAILLGYYPENHIFIDHEAGPTGSRSSALYMFKHMLSPLPVELHIPERHRDIVELVYKKLNAPYSRPESTDIVLQHGETSVNMNRRYNTSKITVSLIGKDTPTEISRAKDDLCNIGRAEVVYLCLPLNQPRVLTLCTECEDMGFFFSGIEPMPGGISDMLRLQYLNTQIDFPNIPIYDETAKKILEHIQGEYRRIHG